MALLISRLAPDGSVGGSSTAAMELTLIESRDEFCSSLPESFGSDFGQGREQVVDDAAGIGPDFDGDGHARG
jgi:hypothetical protein